MFTMVKASEVFPMRSPIKDSDSLAPVHPVIPGECVLFLGETRGGVISLSNYRLYASCPPGFLNIPLGLIDQLEQRDLFFIHIYCKDARSYRIQFSSTNTCEEWSRRIMDEISPPVKIEDIFAFAHFAWACETSFEELSSSSSSGEMSDFTWFRSELARLRFDLQGAWRVSMANMDHKLCPTYPQELLLPASISDSVLEKVAQFRSAKRIPAVVWRNTANGAVLARCSQPEVGWLGWRSSDDEELVRAIAEACAYDSGTTSRHSSGSDISSGSYDPVCHSGEIPSLKDLSAEAAARGEVRKVLIIDARSYAAAVGNRARGGGVECPEYYPNAEILFMNLANIHRIRNSFQALRSLCHAPPDQTSWFQALDSTKWLHHMSGLLRASVRSVTALQTEGRPVIVHCSDGWDRTPQIVSLSQLLLDPYYRTLEGFQVLVEKEWLDFGHKMADRCGQGLGCSDVNERSPIFLQWLDCVHQLLLQFPCHFEFNLTFLVKLAEHTYSNLFGTFLANSLSERRRLRVKERTRSIWGYLRSHPGKFRNFLFVRRDEVLWPRCEVRDLLLWQDVYVGEGVGGSLLGGKEVSSSQGGSREGSENGGENGLAEEIDKLQNGSKESTPDVCPEYRRKSSDSSEESTGCLDPSQFPNFPQPANGQPVPASNTTPRLERRSVIESSTDTLVPESELQKSKKSHNYTLPPLNTQFEETMNSSSISVFSDPLDSDGLVAHHNQVQRRMVEIFSSHQAEVTALRRDLHMSRLALTQAGLKTDQILSQEEHQEHFMDGRSGVESTTSEVSWEAVDDTETRPTLWVPDHAASSCMGCHTQFWFGRRKHHCRSCGRLFCSECSEQAVPIPAEQLYQPVRVCDQCFMHLSQLAGACLDPTTQPVIPCDNTGQEKENPTADNEETAVDAATLDQSPTSEEKAVEKQLEERLNIGAAECQVEQLDKIELKPEATSCNKEVEVEVNNPSSGVEVKVN
eukprot:GFUD01120259.1.p1 GENE.GFUD01120259.1~~GFUD01120259.1.p1  ORF type:complete len:972 (-),score=250.85 GFUD01120259.1:755-3670(-)